MIKKFLISIIELFFPNDGKEQVFDDAYHQTSTSWPAEWYKGLIKTRNRMGAMVTDLGPAERAFIAHAKTHSKPVLDIGCAYGAVARVVLMHEKRIIACDINDEHLGYLKESVPEDWHKRLRTTSHRFPNELSLKSESLSAILAANLINYLRPEEIEEGLDKCYQWLEPGGKIWITSYTPFFLPYHSLREAYKNAAERNEKWPCQFNPHDISQNTWSQLSPDYMQIFKKHELERIVSNHQFEIISSEYFAYDFVKRGLKNSSGKEFLMIEARKPTKNDAPFTAV